MMDYVYRAISAALAAVRTLGLNPAKARPHSLILARPLSSDDNTYTFSLDHKENDSVLPGFARGIMDRDGFVASGMGVGILSVPVIDGVEHPTAASPIFFPDPNVFDGTDAASALTEAQQLETIYNGEYSLKTNEGLRIQNNPLYLFRTAEQTQGSAETTNMQTGIQIKAIGASVRFGGGDENEITIKHTSKDKSLIEGTEDRRNYLVIYLVGAVVKGATTKAYLNQ